MAIIKPFAALLPKPELAALVCELPYDVMSTAEARALAAGNPSSFLHVSRPEIDLPETTNPSDPIVYAKGRDNFRNLVSQGVLAQHPHSALYLYQQIMGTHRQLGLVAVTSCAEYEQGRIRKHELTRPDKEDDRMRHMEALNAQTGPAFLTYHAQPELDEFCAKLVADAKPHVDFQAHDGVRHTSWIIQELEAVQALCCHFSSVDHLYIADGHHRSAAAARLARARNHVGPAAFFLSVLFPHHQLQILPYNRLLADLHGLTPPQLLDKLECPFIIQSASSPTPAQPHEVMLYLSGRWYSLVFRPEHVGHLDPVENLDVSLLQKHVFAPIFSIENPRTSQRIAFVGGIRGTAELEKLVDSGAYACAFSLYPTRIEDLMAIADAGAMMPPKSTWFEPKLRDGMFCHLL
jgi:uncharacterized protein (DUF1015 family)